MLHLGVEIGRKVAERLQYAAAAAGDRHVDIRPGAMLARSRELADSATRPPRSDRCSRPRASTPARTAAVTSAAGRSNTGPFSGSSALPTWLTERELRCRRRSGSRSRSALAVEIAGSPTIAMGEMSPLSERPRWPARVWLSRVRPGRQCRAAGRGRQARIDVEACRSGSPRRRRRRPVEVPLELELVGRGKQGAEVGRDRSPAPAPPG